MVAVEELAIPALECPSDFSVEFSERPQWDKLPITLCWGGEAKVCAVIDESNYRDKSTSIGLRRPDHWGEDTRYMFEQASEWALGISGALEVATRSLEVQRVNVPWVEAEIALGVLNAKTPDGWGREIHIVKSGPIKDARIDLDELADEPSDELLTEIATELIEDGWAITVEYVKGRTEKEHVDESRDRLASRIRELADKYLDDVSAAGELALLAAA